MPDPSLIIGRVPARRRTIARAPARRRDRGGRALARPWPGATSFTHAPRSLATSEDELLSIEERLLNETAEHGRAVVVSCGAAQMLVGPRVISGIPARTELLAPRPRLRALRAGWPGCRALGPRVGPEPLPLHSAADRRPLGHAGVYDITVDSSVVGIEACVAIVLAASQSKLKERSDH
jgi:hypothetical protein